MDCGHDYEDKYLLKYGALEQDFEELQAEAEEATALLKQAKGKKRRLQAEIKFLRKRAMELRELRGCVRSHETPYFARETATGDVPQYFCGPSDGSTGKILVGRDFHTQAFRPQVQPFYSQLSHTEAFDCQAMKPLSKPPPPNGVVFRNPDVVGVLKTSSLKSAPNGIVAARKAGKRKISWQDDYSVKA